MDRLVYFVGLLTALVADVSCQYYGNYYCLPGRDVVVHLFEWKWKDIEAECTWLAANNFCAVQVAFIRYIILISTHFAIIHPHLVLSTL